MGQLCVLLLVIHRGDESEVVSCVCRDNAACWQALTGFTFTENADLEQICNVGY